MLSQKVVVPTVDSWKQSLLLGIVLIKQLQELEHFYLALERPTVFIKSKLFDLYKVKFYNLP